MSLVSVHSAALAVVASAGTPPLRPDAPTARDWLLTELARPPYQAAKPTWFDRASQAVGDWLSHLFAGGGAHLAPVLAAIAAVVVAALVVGTLIVFGTPRLRRRRRPVGARGVFGAEDERTAAELRAAADAAVAAERWDLAVEEFFRAVARRLDDAGLVVLTPGTTARALAAAGGRSLPALAAGLADAADLFDRVRYLDLAAAADDAARLGRLDDAVAAAARRPAPAAAGDGGRP